MSTKSVVPPPTAFREALREYTDIYLRPRLTYTAISRALGKHETWLSSYLSSDRGIPADTLARLYRLLPEIAEDVEAGLVDHPVVRGRGRPRAQTRLDVSVSGPAGAGKTTILSLLSEVLSGHGVKTSVQDDSDELFDITEVSQNLVDLCGRDVEVVLRSVAQ